MITIDLLFTVFVGFIVVIVGIIVWLLTRLGNGKKK